MYINTIGKRLMHNHSYKILKKELNNSLIENKILSDEITNLKMIIFRLESKISNLNLSNCNNHNYKIQKYSDKIKNP